MVFIVALWPVIPLIVVNTFNAVVATGKLLTCQSRPLPTSASGPKGWNERVNRQQGGPCLKSH